MLDTAPSSHKFYSCDFQPSDPKCIMKFVRKEVTLLSANLPPGIIVKSFEDRMVSRAVNPQFQITVGLAFTVRYC